jgi:hypothetical protein
LKLSTSGGALHWPVEVRRWAVVSTNLLARARERNGHRRGPHGSSPRLGCRPRRLDQAVRLERALNPHFPRRTSRARERKGRVQHVSSSEYLEYLNGISQGKSDLADWISQAGACAWSMITTSLPTARTSAATVACRWTNEKPRPEGTGAKSRAWVGAPCLAHSGRLKGSGQTAELPASPALGAVEQKEARTSALT